ncbi:hypothetical protein BDR07DRAFT_1417289 [Suillus spraguei]|nr:hypothetical protein BDR07DRAFT_1417289 [Suillus spraguei]
MSSLLHFQQSLVTISNVPNQSRLVISMLSLFDSKMFVMWKKGMGTKFASDWAPKEVLEGRALDFAELQRVNKELVRLRSWILIQMKMGHGISSAVVERSYRVRVVSALCDVGQRRGKSLYLMMRI